MKLTIMPSTGSVGENDLFYNDLDLSSCNIPGDVHALQWQDTAGWIEYNSPLAQNQPITELPAWANCCMVKWTEANTPKPPEPPTAEQNKTKAVSLLQATDWTTIPDVASPTNNPYLMNQAEFIAYRNEIRKLAVNPVANPVFPPVPTAQWST